MNFKKRFIAPGRICLFGDHQDYLQLPVIACAIDRHIFIDADPIEGSQFVISKPDIKRNYNIPLDLKKLENRKTDHLIASMFVLSEYGCKFDSGFCVEIHGNIPINAGLSSSSAVTVAWILFLVETFGVNVPVTPSFIAEVAYQSEVVMQNSPGGKMDQYAISIGHILYLDTLDNKYQTIDTPLEGLVVGESGIPKETISLLSIKRSQQLKAIAAIKKVVKDFEVRKYTIGDLPKLCPLVAEAHSPYLKAIITNYDITKRALKAIQNKSINYKNIGKLINEHHAVLRDILQITTPLIDHMIDVALKAGAYGAKIVGSGGGGCIAALTPKNKIQEVSDAIKKVGAINAYSTIVDSGAKILKK